MRYETPHGRIYHLFEDMTFQPHLLVAGATGSGKSVVVNGIITTLLYRLPYNQEDGAELILIDPKRVELSPYKRLPHTLYYASEPDTMLSALQYAMDICEDRYREMQTRSERKYTGSDIYVIIDEFADLMTTQRRAVAPLIQRLAQIGRAARIHIILCTQTPISKVLPTEIKCNFDARIGLRTRSAQDSRNILGEKGLENLPIFGNGIYMTPKGTNLYKIPYIDEREQNRLISHWEMQDIQETFRKADEQKAKANKKWWKLW